MLNLFKRRKNIENSQDEIDLSILLQEEEEEPEIVKNCTEEEIEEIKKNRQKAIKSIKRYLLYKKIINILFILAIIIIALITTDVIAVKKYNVGPFFAIKTNTYKDGGTKEYYGLGYKVIKYNELEGRQDTELGTWSLKYNTEPIEVSDEDIAVEFENNYQQTANDYYNAYIRMTSTLKSINKKQLVLQYIDEDGKYTLTIYCDMKEKTNEELELGQPITIKGTVKQFKIKTEKNYNSVYINSCFIEK